MKTTPQRTFLAWALGGLLVLLLLLLLVAAAKLGGQAGTKHPPKQRRVVTRRAPRPGYRRVLTPYATLPIPTAEPSEPPPSPTTKGVNNRDTDGNDPQTAGCVKVYDDNDPNCASTQPVTALLDTCKPGNMVEEQVGSGRTPTDCHSGKPSTSLFDCGTLTCSGGKKPKCETERVLACGRDTSGMGKEAARCKCV